jgi:hypothetical protein
MTTNERDLLRLINECSALGSSRTFRIAVQLTDAYLPENILRQANAILERMQPDLEVLDVKGEPVHSQPPEIDDLPPGLIPDPPEWKTRHFKLPKRDTPHSEGTTPVPVAAPTPASEPTESGRSCPQCGFAMFLEGKHLVCPNCYHTKLV